MKTTALAQQLPPPAALSPSPAPSAPKPKPKSSAPGYSSADTVELKAPQKKASYSPAPTKADVESGKAKLKMGQQGPAVGELQKKLGVVATGRFDKNTEVAVAQAQTKAGLPPTGVVDQKTLAVIEGKSAPKGPEAPVQAPDSSPQAKVDALAKEMSAGTADVGKAKAQLDQIPGVVRIGPSYPRELKDQIHLHNLQHLTKKLKAKEPLSAEEQKLAQGYLDEHAKDMSAPSATSLTELNQVYGGAYGQFVQAAGAAGMKAKP
jgi:peptidoglycan hydrolase-like protein with peptidoglycan-binding domain